MVLRCVVASCGNVKGNGISLHKWTNDQQQSRLWKQFVVRTRAKWPGPSENSQICSAHFEESQYLNFRKYKEGYANKLLLKPGALPTIYPEKEETSYKKTSPKKRAAYRKREVNRLLTEVASAQGATSVDVEDMDVDEDSTRQGEEQFAVIDPGRSTCDAQTYTDLRYTKKKSRTFGTQTDEPGLTYTMDKAVQANRRKKRPEHDQRASTPVLTSEGEDEDDDPKDKTWDPNMEFESAGLEIPREDKQPHEERKYIVFRSKLWELFETCPVCESPCLVEDTYKKGTMVQIAQTCSNKHCTYQRRWNSQPIIKDIPAGNLILSGAITFTGLSPTKVIRLLNAMKIACYSKSAYDEQTAAFINPTVWHLWTREQKLVLDTLRSMSGKLQCSGDSRSDSPGHCAKMGTYTMMETRINKVLTMKLVQSNQVGGSYHMEKEGLTQCLAFLEEEGLELGTLVTDRHPSIQKMMREEYKSVVHYYDVWHVGTGFSRKAETLAKQKDCEDVRPWIKSMVNHLYWCASSTPDGDGAVMEAKWRSLSNHIQNVHDGHSDVYPVCAHPPLTEQQERKKKWLIPSTKGCEKLSELINNTRLCKDVRKLSPHQQTSSLEALHSLMLHWSPKNKAFGFIGMMIRHCLTALHWNENSSREQKRTANGELKFDIVFPKAKRGDYSLKPVKEDPTFEYICKLYDVLFGEVVLNPGPFQDGLESALPVPPPLAASYTRPSADEISDKAQIYSRYAANS